ncbi:hypothetical protein [Sodalis-like endosymbiont of Proechinophthirus fluctus]|uniref:hypothetical protein n=1 Tax=Sodalis-like endosymbiont of Proechinophthirus fluctus TaxID=1462730 RepID=UPI0034E97F4C
MLGDLGEINVIKAIFWRKRRQPGAQLDKISHWHLTRRGRQYRNAVCCACVEERESAATLNFTHSSDPAAADKIQASGSAVR